ncbi:hypothetical protein [Desulfosporosinus hippei]|uniref:Uncharacterized protein n=1 Tax=Desulfosporosinus hippei DSM 8344 TaxID=1121419 RepID=A0A1G7UKB8_9FIRM|nr:hypothetical protein [Desulfosporosinus hippei]SDG47933.1 hypothetical protein SAMN05443529_103170 [Desulfosporosinus hippei DSM 8344]
MTKMRVPGVEQPLYTLEVVSSAPIQLVDGVLAVKGEMSMECPKEIRQCPNGWTDCKLCAYWDSQYKKCVYVPEEPESEPEPISELTENELTTDLGVNIPSVRGTWAEKFLSLSPDEALKQFYSKHPPDLVSKEPITCMDGPIVPGGSSRGRVPKKPKKKIPEYLKLFGQQI